jgi:uncharacterized membrane protein
VVDTVMIWIALCLPLMIVGVAIATLPLIWAMVHERRFGSGERPCGDRAAPIASLPMERPVAEMSVCAMCSSVVTDVEAHVRAIHRLAA